MNRYPDSNDDIIDSRDVIKAIDDLKQEWDDAEAEDHANRVEHGEAEGEPRTHEDFELSEDDWAHHLGEDDAHLLVALMALQEEAEDYAADWLYGETLIRDSYFEDYAQQLAEDIGAIPRDLSWPLYSINWERAARDLQMDYTSVEFDGVTYWIR